MIDWTSWFRVRRSVANYLECLRNFDETFGRKHVDVYAFNPSDFPNGCAVLSFCQRVGIRMPQQKVIGVNESLNANVIKCLYAWNRFSPTSGRARMENIRRAVLLRNLQSLQGPRFSFHQSLNTELIQRFQDQQPLIEERLGTPFPATLRKRDADDGVRSEEDLMDFGPEILQWLAEKTGQSRISAGRGEDTASKVAQQMQTLASLTRPANILAETRERLRMVWQKFRHFRR